MTTFDGNESTRQNVKQQNLFKLNLVTMITCFLHFWSTRWKRWGAPIERAAWWASDSTHHQWPPVMGTKARDKMWSKTTVEPWPPVHRVALKKRVVRSQGKKKSTRYRLEKKDSQKTDDGKAIRASASLIMKANHSVSTPSLIGRCLPYWLSCSVFNSALHSLTSIAKGYHRRELSNDIVSCHSIK